MLESRDRKELREYRETGLSPKQINKFIDHFVRGYCPFCVHGIPYKNKSDSGLYKCSLDKQGEYTVASIRNRGCRHWSLKQMQEE